MPCIARSCRSATGKRSEATIAVRPVVFSRFNCFFLNESQQSALFLQAPQRKVSLGTELTQLHAGRAPGGRTAVLQAASALSTACKAKCKAEPCISIEFITRCLNTVWNYGN